MTTAIETPKTPTVDMKFEIVVIPVSDVDRAKRFYGGLGWRLDADFASGDDYRVIEFTPPAACTPARTSRICLGGSGLAVRILSIAATALSPRSKIRTATAGCSRRSPRDCPDAWTGTRPSPRRLSSRPRFGVRRRRTAS